jgi:AcrR family transcriptional regulator
LSQTAKLFNGGDICMSVKENRSGRQTKEWILETACKLFNEHGTAAISTKRIAKEMGISPGNLYYHFKNKEDIILTLFDQDKNSYIGDWTNSHIPPLQRFWNITKEVVMLWQDCRFFKKEMVTLAENDPRLKEGYQELVQNIRRNAQFLFQDLIEANLVNLQKLSDLFEPLLTISNIIANHWLTHLDLNDLPLTMENLQQGAELVLLVWEPYLTDEALVELNRLKQEQDDCSALI